MKALLGRMGLAALATAAALLPASSRAAPPPPAAKGAVADSWRAAEAHYRSALERHHIVGSSLLLLRDGKVAGRALHGLQDQAGKSPVTEDTIFHWASITKTFTGIAILQLRDRGLLSLDDPAVKYLPELRQVHNPHGDMAQVTLRHLLSHSAGFRGGHLALVRRQGLGALRAAPLRAARRHVALHRAALRPRQPLQLLQPGDRVPGADHRGPHQRGLRGVRRQEHAPAARHAAQLLRPDAALPAATALAQLLLRRARGSARRASTSTPASPSRTAG